MADAKLTETAGDEDDKIELVAVETPPEEKKPLEGEKNPDDGADADGVDDDHDEDEGDDEGDAKLGGNADDDEDEITGKAKTNRERRLKRREQQRLAKERAEAELRFLRQQVQILEQRQRAIETTGLDQQVQSIEAKLAEAQRDVQQAERIIAKATEAGNGEDVVAAMRIRDEALAERNQLTVAKQQLLTAKQQAAAPAGPDPRVVSLAQAWTQANPWYDPNGADEDSIATKAIDAQLAREGYDPRDISYWQELTNRVQSRLSGASAATPAAPRREKAPAAGRPKEPPPQGGTREHAPVTTRKEIYVTPERKQAMIDAGVWDDPARRAKYLKAYAAYDRSAR